jgi:beta-glucosidase
VTYLPRWRRCVAVAVAATVVGASTATAAPAVDRWRDPSVPLPARVDDLISRLTLDEKISLLHQYQVPIPRLGIGFFKTGTEALHGVAWTTDFYHGGAVVTAQGTVFPQAVGLGSTWDPALIKQVGDAVGQEARGYNVKDPTVWDLNLWAPVVNLLRDPRWGRNEEGYSEDPYLTGSISTAYGKGIEGDDPRYLQAAPTLKHYLAYNNEVSRTTSNSSVPPKILHDYDEQAFKPALTANAATGVMPSYNLVNGRPSTVSPDLDGAVRSWSSQDMAIVSDAGAPSNLTGSEHYYATKPEAVAAAIKAGLDSFTDNDTNTSIITGAIKSAVDQKLLTVADVERADRHMLSLRFRFGEFDPPTANNPYAKITPAVINSPEHQALARKAADEQVVLLRNDNGVLPLKADQNKKVAVVGPLADTLYTDWYSGNLPYRVTPVQGVRERLGANGTVSATEGVDRIALKNNATGRYLTSPTTDGALAQGPTTAGANESMDVFDWGAGKVTLRTVANGKYLSLGANRTLVNNAAQPNGWYVQQQLKLDLQSDGSYVLEYGGNDSGGNRYAVVGSNGIVTMGAATPAAATKFTKQVVSSGLSTAVSAVTGADTAVVVVGSMPFINGREADDRTSTELAPGQLALVQAVQKANPHTVVVVENSYPTTGWDKQTVPGLLWTSHAGQETGHAIADVLFGDVNPAGRLPQTWYTSDAQLPSILNYDIAKTGMTYLYHQGPVLFPFGYGLSYSTFRYANIHATPQGDAVQVTVDVTNTGTRAGDEVIQLYTHQQQSRVRQPVRQLRDFQRVNLAPGQTRTVTFTVRTSALAFWDVTRSRPVVEAGTYDFQAGSSSQDIRQSAAVAVPGEKIPPRDLSQLTPAQNFDDYQGVTLIDQSKAAGTSVAATAGASLVYKDVQLANGGTVTASVSNPNSAAAHVTVKLETGQVLGRLTVPSTGDKYKYVNVSAGLTKVTGRHDVYLSFDGPANLNSFRIS